MHLTALHIWEINDMKQNRNSICLTVIAALVIFAGCSQKRAAPISGEATINDVCDSLWTYFSFETGAVVGQSKFCDRQEDEMWASRKDWDIAFCGELLRTNGGTSGTGVGGIQKNTITDFYNLTEAPVDGYIQDSIVVVCR